MTAEPSAATPTRSWTFAMVDLAGYTALTEAHGDEHAADLATRFAEIATQSLGPEDRLIKPIGDAVLLACPDPDAGLRVVDELLWACSELDGFPVARAGLHHGPAVERAGDMFGTTVNVAARLAGIAAGGQVVASREVADTARERGMPVSTLGVVELRNLTTPVELFDVGIGPVRTTGSIDPVCRMWVDHARAVGRFRHDNTDYWFCSRDCAARFVTAPGAFTST